MDSREPRLTDKEAAAFIIKRWTLDHTPAAIMIALVMLGMPLTKAQVLEVVRKWIDAATENKTYRVR